MSQLAAIEEFVARRKEAAKQAGPATNANVGTATYINGTRFRGLLDDTVSVSQWLKAGARMVEVDPGQNTIQVRNWEGVRWHHLPDNRDGDPDFDATVLPADREVAITPAHYVMEMQLNIRAQRRARAMLNADLRRNDELGFAKAFGNNMARTAIKGDPASVDPSLNGTTGLRILAAANGRTLDLSDNVGGVLVARAFDPDEVFWQALDLMPSGLRSNGLKWYGNDRLWIQWARWLANSTTGERHRDDIARGALMEAEAAGPLGRGYLQIPDWPADDGPNANPTAVADDGDGTATIRVASVLPDVNDYSGRRVRVTLDASGQFEELTVVRVGGQNQALSTGDFGQAVISAVAADYTVAVVDETSICLMDPAGFLLALENAVEIYRNFDTRGLNSEVLAHIFMDTRLLRPDAVVFVNGFFIQRRA